MDYLVKEIRDYRDKIAEKCDYDPYKLYEYIKKRKKKWKNPVADLKPVAPFSGVAEKQAEYK